MITVTFSQLRNQAKKYFDAVERGEILEVFRHGKPIAIVSPSRNRAMDRWKTARPLALNGVSVSRAILGEREEDR